MRYSIHRRGGPMVLAGELVASLLAGCGATSLGLGSSEQQSATTGCSPGGPQDALPPAVKPGTTLTVASDASYEPNGFLASDGQAIVGMDIDLRKGALQCIDLKGKCQNAKFDNILPGAAGNPEQVDPTKPCGHSVGLQTGTTQADEIEALNKGVAEQEQHAAATAKHLQAAHGGLPE